MHRILVDGTEFRWTWKGRSVDSEEKHEPVRDIDTAVAKGLKVLDPNRRIREADKNGRG